MYRLSSVAALLAAVFLFAAASPNNLAGDDPTKKKPPTPKSKPATAPKTKPKDASGGKSKSTAKKAAKKTAPKVAARRGHWGYSSTYTVWGKPRHRHSRSFTNHSQAVSFARSMRKRHQSPVVHQRGSSLWTVSYGRTHWRRYMRTSHLPPAQATATQLRSRGMRAHISHHRHRHWVVGTPTSKPVKRPS